MDLKRFWRHVVMSPVRARRAFPPATLDAIQREVAAREKLHRGELIVVVEAELGSALLWQGITPRERARTVFALQGAWNTEENNGVLIYLLLADRCVEIVADRGISRQVPPADWQAICRMMEGHFAAGRYEEGALAGVRAASDLLARHFPGHGSAELADRPVLI
jgi:TLP18.3/Psb32/MOLO-1 phosphatase superfamily protein